MIIMSLEDEARESLWEDLDTERRARQEQAAAAIELAALLARSGVKPVKARTRLGGERGEVRQGWVLVGAKKRYRGPKTFGSPNYTWQVGIFVGTDGVVYDYRAGLRSRRLVRINSDGDTKLLLDTAKQVVQGKFRNLDEAAYRLYLGQVWFGLIILAMVILAQIGFFIARLT